VTAYEWRHLAGAAHFEGSPGEGCHPDLSGRSALDTVSAALERRRLGDLQDEPEHDCGRAPPAPASIIDLRAPLVT